MEGSQELLDEWAEHWREDIEWYEKEIKRCESQIEAHRLTIQRIKGHIAYLQNGDNTSPPAEARRPQGGVQ